MTESEAKGKVPYRAFAYLPFARFDEDISGDFTVSFPFKTRGARSFGAYTKLFFWGDGVNFLGLLPPGAPGAKSSDQNALRLVVFPEDDFPNQWEGEVVVEDEGKWINVELKITTGDEVKITVLGKSWTKTFKDARFLESSNGPQLGVYSFDYGGNAKGQLTLAVGEVKGPEGSAERSECVLSCLEKCTQGTPTPTPTPMPTPTPSPSSKGKCCWGGGGSCQAAADCHADVFCDASKTQCTENCNGVWCEAKVVGKAGLLEMALSES